ncbi:DUF4101 domain-containing protein [filamentous cyanobacterium LEGE 11480]|uniref:non-specific serine/threonine protein kinase n=1 Tax=Romeriopsis navalis LEGE 11480 TaxID=2777977 RepID=A0A928VPE5_9CYAN|nr:IMS domain-containing protein [Romeriopsis navalis]MBE9029634.1 DUF4101 domain-containing protein [Romeriopsis navalis LEGE 11480]
MLNDRYQIIRPLATGGMGQTYVAADTQRPGNPHCVVKQLKPASTDPDFLVVARRLFQSEATILEKLGRRHDQIPQLLAYFEQDEEFYLVQDLIEGHPLTAEMQLGQRWDEAQVLELLQSVLELLAVIHQEGVIHRDIKPDNLIRRDQDNKLCLIDFGSVKQIRLSQVLNSQPTTYSQLIGPTVAVGTPGYMSAEQYKGKPRPSSDLYSLGIIAVQALTGMLPAQLREDDNGELIWRDQSADISPSLTDFIAKLVSIYLKDRFTSAPEAQQALQQILTDSPDAITIPPSQPAIVPAAVPPLIPDSIATTPQKRTQPDAVPPPPVQPEPTQVAIPQSAAPTHAASPATGSNVVVGILMGMTLLGGIGGGLYAYTRLQQSRALQNIEQLYNAKQFKQCNSQAQSFPQYHADLHRRSQALLTQCQDAQTLENIDLLVQRGTAAEFAQAVDLAMSIPSDAAIYEPAQRLILRSSEKILDLAEQKYFSGGDSDYAEALRLVKAIPREAPVYDEANNQLRKWKTEEARNQQDEKRAETALKAKRWNAADQAANKLATSPVKGWQKIAKSLKAKAKQGRDAERKKAANDRLTRARQRQLLSLINQWMRAKSTIFAPPFNRQRARQLMTGDLLKGVLARMDELEESDAYYRYGRFKVTFQSGQDLLSDRPTLDVQIRQKFTLVEDGDAAAEQSDEGRYRYTFVREAGRWKTVKREELKS